MPRRATKERRSAIFDSSESFAGNGAILHLASAQLRSNHFSCLLLLQEINITALYQVGTEEILRFIIIIWEWNLLQRMKQHDQTMGYFKHVRYIWAWGCYFLCSLPHFVTELSQQRRWVIVLCLDGNAAPEEIFFPTSDFGRRNFWLLVTVELFCFHPLLIVNIFGHLRMRNPAPG